jgi:MFS family permease
LKKRTVVLIFLIALGAITFLDRLVIAVAGPRMQDELDMSPEQWGWILGAFVLSYALFQIPLGSLADRIGQRKVAAGIVVWWSAFTSLTGLASSFRTLVAIRFLFGIGEAGAYPTMSGAVARWFPVNERARAQGFIWGASRAGGALAPWIVVPIQQAFGWRVTFVLLGVLGIVWGVLWWIWFRDRPSEQPGIKSAELAELGEQGTAEARTPAPWGRFLRNPQFWLILTMYWFYVWGSWFYFSWLHTYLVKGRGFSIGEMGLFSALPFALGTFSNVAGGFLSDSLSKKYGLLVGRRLVGATSLAVSAILLAGAGLVTNKAAIIALLSLSFGVMDIMLPAAWAICLDIGRKHAGSITGAMNTAGNLGGFVCTVLFGYLVRAFGSYNAPIFVIAGMLFISSVLFSFIDPTRELAPEQSEGDDSRG